MGGSGLTSGERRLGPERLPRRAESRGGGGGLLMGTTGKRLARAAGRSPINGCGCDAQPAVSTNKNNNGFRTVGVAQREGGLPIIAAARYTR